MIQTTMTVTVNAAFLREIKEDNVRLGELLEELRSITRHPSVAVNHVARFLHLIAELRDQLALHFALEEAYGYFENAVAVAPRLSERTDQLRAEHKSLYEQLCAAADRADEYRARHTVNGAARRLAAWFCHFDEQLRQHELAEQQLIVEALERDIGVGD